MRIKPDLWQSAYSGAVETAAEAPRKYQVQVDVESPAGCFGCVPILLPAPIGAVAFVDGTPRVEMHATVDGEVPRFGLFGAVAWGALRMEGTRPHDLLSSLMDLQVFRYFITNAADLAESTITLQSAPHDPSRLVYTVRSVQRDPADFHHALTDWMRAGEGELAAVLVKDPEIDLVLADGPIPYERTLVDESGKLAGLIKSVREFYLAGAELKAVATLKYSQRTHLFAIRYPDSDISKLSFFLRLQPLSPYSSPWSNLARVELPYMSLSQAQDLAERAARAALRFASNLWADRRAPQNLYPVAALEQALKNRLGDVNLLRSRILATLAKE